MTFWLVSPIRAGLDAQGVKERVGLTTMMGSARIASVFAGTPAARQIDQIKEFTVCEPCAMTVPLAVLALSEDDD